MATILCAVLFAAAVPRVINHPRIPMKADPAAFEPARTGCKADGSCEKGPIADLGCTGIESDDDLAGLPLPTAHCWIVKWGTPRPDMKDYIHGPHGMMPIFERFVVLDQGRYRLIKNMAEYYATAAPVTSAAQALSTAVAIRGVHPMYGAKAVAGYRYHVTTIEDTYVTPGGHDDFIVHNLWEPTIFGCGPHSTYLVTMRVPRVGGVTEVSSVKAFEDPKQDGLCVD